MNANQVIVLAQIAGTGVKPTSNTALLLRTSGGTYMELLRAGDIAPGIGRNGITVGSISAVDVEFGAISGRYTVLGTLKGAPASANQALWRGNIQAPVATARRPVLILRKGDRYTTSESFSETIRSISLRPALDPGGAGRTGTSNVVNNTGEVLAILTGDRKTQEVVVVSP